MNSGLNSNKIESMKKEENDDMSNGSFSYEESMKQGYNLYSLQ